jgi:hypothetical protein
MLLREDVVTAMLVSGFTPPEKEKKMSLSQLSEKIGFEYSLRRPTGDDFQYIHALINTYEISLTGIAETTASDLRMELSAPGFEMATDS